MLAYLIFAITAIVVLLAAIVYLYPGSRKLTTVPGLEPSDPKDGNLGDMGKAGSLHEFLMELHSTYGPIASYWMGQKLTVSIASPELFKEHNHVFDRPHDLFLLFEPLITMDSIQFANGTDGRKRRKLFDSSFSHQAIIDYYDTFQKNGEELARKWAATPKDEHIPLEQTMFAVVIKGIAATSFGDLFNNDKEVLQLKNNYDVCWTEMERRFGGEFPAPDSPAQKHFDNAKTEMHNLIRKAMQLRKKVNVKEGHEILIDNIMKIGSENQKLADAVTYMAGGIHTSGLWLTWSLYYMAIHPEIQEKVYKELVDVLEEEKVTHENLSALKYLRQVLDETLRCSTLAPFAARFQELETEVGGHKLPPGTPVVHALGVVLNDAELYPEPTKFDPDRFNEENSKSRSFYAFQPFGFSGKRKCPGYQFAYVEVTVLLSILLRKLRIKLVDGQVVQKDYGLVTSPKDEIWITVEKRK